MKIYLIGSTKEEIARDLSDKHVFTLITQYSELLSSIHKQNTFLDDAVYNKYKNKNCVFNWVMSSRQNYMWLYELFVELSKEYKLRYHKDHMHFVNLNFTLAKIPLLPDIGLTKYTTNIPKKYIMENELDTHRNYYANEKIKFATWRPPAVIPDWIIKFKR